jgi:hypothetical protein
MNDMLIIYLPTVWAEFNSCHALRFAELHSQKIFSCYVSLTNHRQRSMHNMFTLFSVYRLA